MSVHSSNSIAQVQYPAPEIRCSVRRPAVGTAWSFGALVAFLALLYSQLPLLLPALEEFRVVYVVGGTAMLVVVVERMLARREFEFVWPESYLLFGFVVVAGLSCFDAIWMHYAVENTLNLIKMASLYFIIINAVSNIAKLRNVIWVMVVGGLFPALGALWNYSQGIQIEGRAYWVGIFMNPNELAYSLVILIPLAVSLAATGSRRSASVFWLFSALYVASIYLSFSRGGMLGLLAVLALAGLRWKSTAARTVTFVLLVGALVWIAYGWSRQEGFDQLATDATVHQRFETIRAGLAMFVDHPMFGVGLGSSVVAWPLYASSAAYGGKWLIIHNTFMQVLSETGITGFLLFGLLLATAIHDAWTIGKNSRIQQTQAATLATGLELSLWAFVVCGLSGGFALTWFPYILIGLVAALKKIATEPSFASTSPMRTRPG